MRKKVIAGNWKMNMTSLQTMDYMEQFKTNKIDENRTVIFFAPFTSLHALKEESLETEIKVGAQNMHFAENGAFTGEVSAEMLLDAGMEYVLIGHSERRQYFNETDETVNKKLHTALKHDLKPVLCVGESLEQREHGMTASLVKSQVEAAFKEITTEDAIKVIIAYEPIWAIGTGKTATKEDANEVCGIIRDTIEKLYNKGISENMIILYGGSVNSKNAKELFDMEHIDGGLVGGASLKPDEFIKVVNNDAQI